MRPLDRSVLQINTSDRGGGAAKVAWQLFDALRLSGYRSKFAAGYRKSRDPDVLTIYHDQGRFRERFFGRIDKCFDLVFGGIRGSYYLRAFLHKLAEPQAAKDIARGLSDHHYPGIRYLFDRIGFTPAILHLHNLHGNYFDLRALPVLASQTRLVWTLHDEWAMTGSCHYTWDCPRWETGCGQCPRIGPDRPRPDATDKNWQLKKTIYEKCSLVVCAPSRWLLDKAKRSVLSAKEYHLIPNGVDLSIFKPEDKKKVRERLELPVHDDLLIFAGHKATLNPCKDYATLESALMTISRALGGRRLALICLGSRGKEKHMGNVHIRYVPYLYDEKDVANYFQAADICVHTVKADNAPLAVIEALACGTPVVASAVDGIPELIEDGASGSLVPAGSHELTAQAVVRILKNQRLRMEMGQKARTRAVDLYDLNQMTRRYFSLYERIAQNG